MRRPLSVVGTDQEALRALLTLHACPEPRILDVTHNRGRIWIVLRNGPDCISPTAPQADVKPRTGEMFSDIEVA